MSWTYPEQSRSVNIAVPYVENCYQPPVQAQAQRQTLLPTTPIQSFCSDWPTPSTESRLRQVPSLASFRFQQQEDTRARWNLTNRAISHSNARGLGLHINTDPVAQVNTKVCKIERHDQSLAQIVPVQPSRRVPSSPGGVQTPRSVPPLVLSHQAISTSLYTPPSSAGQFYPSQQHQSSQSAASMTQRRMSSYGQRPIMGPPETPSRGTIPQSPNLFPNIQFSPDLFSQHSMDAQSAPIYPQQRLFWDPATATPLQSTPQQFHTPIAFPDHFNNSFISNPTTLPPNFTTSQEDIPYDLPTTSQSMHNSFMGDSVFPAPFQTSPRLALPPLENPTQFLSSPARRFGGETKVENSIVGRTVPELPAYHHQIQDSKREKEILARERRKSRTLKRATDDDIVMKSVRRALSPRKISRPSMTRSATFAGAELSARRSSLALDNVSISSRTSSRSTRAGRSSPIRQPSNSQRKSSAPGSLRSRSSVTLAIDEHGVARTVMNPLPEIGDEDTEDDDMTDRLSSEDEYDQHMLYSFGGDQYSDDHDPLIPRGDAREALGRQSTYLSMDSNRVAKISRAPLPLDPRLDGFDPAGTIRRTRTETLSTTADTTGPTNAQQALRAMMQDRSRSASSHASNSSHSQSMQFHSSPPLQHSQLHGFNLSPTTIADPDLATPSTDVDSLSSLGATRCVCNSASPDGNIMIQCDSCQKCYMRNVLV